MLTVLNSSNDPFYNLAFEEYVYQNFCGDDVFLLWKNAPCVVVGRYQNICGEVQVSALRRAGIPVLRRISGGGTVYHDPGNLNYSLMLPQQDMDYERCLRPVIDALNAIGVPAKRNRSCDIAIGGQKISGSAQWASHGRLLHHGTLLFDSDLRALDAITTRHKSDSFNSKGTASAICTVTNIRDHLASFMDMDAFSAALLDQMLPPGSARLRLTPEQEAQVRQLRDEKYRSWEWIWGKNPAFSMERSGEFAGSPLRVRYNARRGVVSDFHLYSDALDCARAEARFNGARLDPDGFAEICLELAGPRAEALLELLI